MCRKAGNVVNDISESLEWRSVVNASLAVDVRASLPTLDSTGIIAYTDGACIKNPGGPAGWSALLWAATDVGTGDPPPTAPCVECFGHIPKSPQTTNNRAEIAAVLAVLSLAPPTLPLTIYSDSEYTIKVAQGTYQMKANPDLWAAYRKLVGYRKQAPKFIWVQGHAGHQHNERADQLAGLGAWNNDPAAYEKWQASQAPEARAGISAAQLATLKLQIQQLQTFCESVANESGRVSLQERKFIEDMAKKMQKNRFAPTEKQQNWVTVLIKKYRIR
jgi:ribonuclease HI